MVSDVTTKTKLGLCCTLLLGFLVGASVTYAMGGDDSSQAEEPGPAHKTPYQIPPLVNMACPYYSPTWPSNGGPDCPSACPDGRTSVGVAFYDVFPRHFTDKVTKAAQRVMALDAAHTTYVENDAGNAFMNSHISFAYYCCQTEEEKQAIKAVLENWDGWTPHEVKFSSVSCAMDGPTFDHVSLVINLDEPSNALMMSWVAALERKLELEGINLNVHRWQQEPFHSTLAVVNGSGYPVSQAVQRLNAEHPPGSWTSQPVKLVKPCPKGFFC